MSGRPIYFDPSKPGHLSRAEKLLDGATLLDDGVDQVEQIALEEPHQNAPEAPAALDAFALRAWILKAANSKGCEAAGGAAKGCAATGCSCVDLFGELRAVATALRSEEIAPPSRVSPEDRAATLADLLKICDDPAEHSLLEKILQHIPTSNLLVSWVQTWGVRTNRLPRPIEASGLTVLELREVIRLAQASSLPASRGRPRAREESSAVRRTRIVEHCQPIIEAVERLMPWQSIDTALWCELFDLFFLSDRPGEFNTDYRHALQRHREADLGNFRERA